MFHLFLCLDRTVTPPPIRALVWSCMRTEKRAPSGIRGIRPEGPLAPSGIRGVRPEGPVASEWDSWGSTRGPSVTKGVPLVAPTVGSVGFDPRAALASEWDSTRPGAGFPPVVNRLLNRLLNRLENRLLNPPIEATCKLHPPRNRPITWFKLRLIITIYRSARWLLRAVNRYPWDTRTVEFDLSRALFLS